MTDVAVEEVHVAQGAWVAQHMSGVGSTEHAVVHGLVKLKERYSYLSLPPLRSTGWIRAVADKNLRGPVCLYPLTTTLSRIPYVLLDA